MDKNTKNTEEEISVLFTPEEAVFVSDAVKAYAKTDRKMAMAIQTRLVKAILALADETEELTKDDVGASTDGDLTGLKETLQLCKQLFELADKLGS